LEPLIAGMFAERDLQAKSLVLRFHVDLQQMLQPSPSIAVGSVVARALAEEAEARPAEPVAERWQRLTTRIKQSLGLAETEDEASPLACLPRAIDSALARSSQDLAERLGQFVKV